MDTWKGTEIIENRVNCIQSFIISPSIVNFVTPSAASVEKGQECFIKALATYWCELFVKL